MDNATIISVAIQSILFAALVALVASVTPKLKTAIDAYVAGVKANQDEQTQALIDNTVNTAVLAAQQLYTANSDKIDFALEFARSYLANRGVYLDLHELRNLLEAEVQRVFKLPVA